MTNIEIPTITSQLDIVTGGRRADPPVDKPSHYPNNMNDAHEHHRKRSRNGLGGGIQGEAKRKVSR